MTRNEILQSAKPILFNTQMVQAVMDSRKTVTRRVVKPQPKYCVMSVSGLLKSESPISVRNGIIYANCGELVKRTFKVGDILYVRETWSTQYNGIDDDNGYGVYVYKADCTKLDNAEGMGWSKWHPSIHMPKEAARIFLRVTDVRVERLRDITLKDMKAEGLKAKSAGDMCKSCLISDKDKCNESLCEITFTNEYSNDFACLWDSTIPKQDLDQYGWNSNPWVWVYEFERVSVDE